MTEWMRDSGNGVTSEDYLLGKEIDKNFEQQGTMGQINAVEYDCVPESLFSSRAEHQVDLQRKLAEDPLVFLRRREIDQKKKLMENPIKMKQLKAYIEKTKKERKKHKKEKKKKKKRSKSSSGEEDHAKDDEDEEDLDLLLLKKMGHDVSEMEKSRKEAENAEPVAGSSRDAAEEDSPDGRQRRRQNPNTMPIRNDRRQQRRSRSPPRRRRSRSRSPPPRKRRTSRSRSRSPDRRQQQRRRRSRSRERGGGGKKSSLDDAEREKRLREMMSNADWRDDQRTKNVKHYREMDAKQEEAERADKDPDFIRRQLDKAAASGSVEKRIQANRHNIQRGHNSMDANFARR